MPLKQTGPLLNMNMTEITVSCGIVPPDNEPKPTKSRRITQRSKTLQLTARSLIHDNRILSESIFHCCLSARDLEALIEGLANGK